MKSLSQNNVTATWVEKLIKGFLNDSPDNTLASEKNEKDWILKKAWSDSLLKRY